MMQAFEIKTNKSDYPYLVVASTMTKAINIYCILAEETEVPIESVKVLPYPNYQIFVPSMVEEQVKQSAKP
ncbi:MAG: hypothetical protein IKW84_09000 [Bacteroidaceae bacterium]|nr:hypothetical protein [Bacteroidaceae bacterium]MBR5159700.1 hypothetical protein [Bacteroidaceae bacterium]